MIENRKKDIWWKPALEIFSQVSSWIAVPIILALVLGKYLDGKFSTKPWIFLALAALGFLVSCVGIVRVVKRYNEKLKEINKENNGNRN